MNGNDDTQFSGDIYFNRKLSPEYREHLKNFIEDKRVKWGDDLPEEYDYTIVGDKLEKCIRPIRLLGENFEDLDDTKKISVPLYVIAPLSSVLFGIYIYFLFGV